MKIRELVDHWDKHGRGRLTREPTFVSLSEEHHQLLQRLVELYPLKSPQELMRDLLTAALDDLETGLPYKQGDKVVAYDEDGFEIYEDEGLTPQFVALSKKHMQRLKKRPQSPA
ncbi:hypothetical protein SAMN05216429_10637 [Marinobacter persicus]|uniref:Pilin assembly protein n=1 Tax=Marinobacter persicus TaxID=930118 RepID=A0A1I3UAM3_9GAMM|nr:pilin assembly protein [Marinobacter persicus]GHD40080.1 hypothetical protein GCM10008110_00600 [Marinobacter persicus]SFJ80050.1 hypothetical protein SAMN05216429_10637 [Marinobacter persicus]